MSPLLYWGNPAWHDFPRVSGDEPLMGLATTDLTEFSPRERG